MNNIKDKLANFVLSGIVRIFYDYTEQSGWQHVHYNEIQNHIQLQTDVLI